MTINFYHAVNEDGLFNVLGSLFFAQKTINTARLTTVPAAVVGAQDLVDNLANTLEIDETLSSDMSSYQRSGDAMMSALQRVAKSVLVQMVHADAVLDSPTVENALTELIEQMEDNSETVDQSTPAVAVAAVGTPEGNGVIVASIYDGQGRLLENMLAETITASVTRQGPYAAVRFTGDPSVSALHEDYAAAYTGSGCSYSMTSNEPSKSLLANGDFEDEDDVTNAPDDWIVSVGTIGTTILMTDVEVQTVIMSGTPTAGYYRLHWVNADGDSQTTIPIAYNAAGGAVQAALRKLEGLEYITVATTGDSPNYTHTITFTGRGGNVAQLTSTDYTTGGTHSIAHATSTPGTAQVFEGSKALILDSNGAELTTINQRIENLEAETPYAVNLSAIADVVPAAGVITVDLVDGIGGTVIADTAGTDNTVSFDAADLSNAAWQDLATLVTSECVFRLPAVVPDIVYFRIRISTAVSNTTSVFLDAASLVKMSQLYPGGPFVAVFSGGNRFREADEWTLTVTNDRAGELQDYFERNFGMSALDQLLPSAAGAAETIPDTVVS